MIFTVPGCIKVDLSFERLNGVDAPGLYKNRVAGRPPHKFLSNQHGFRARFVQRREICFRKMIHSADRCLQRLSNLRSLLMLASPQFLRTAFRFEISLNSRSAAGSALIAQV